ncbi:MAG TPA: catechol 2,3-dioxygenase [Burkholderiales bacterium]|nr:catechol 2,3-dioxygenase [Burkholderiales bacterium]
MNQAGIKIADIAYGRLRAPDLDAMEEFLTEFGMFRSARTATALYMRGTDPAHHIHVTERGAPGFVGISYRANSEEDLKALATLPGASGIEHIDEPGGGKRVRLRDPFSAFPIDVVHGIAELPRVPVGDRPLRWSAEVLETVGEPRRFQFGPSRVRRLSHAVLATPRLKETLGWFRQTFGLLCTDEFYVGDRSNVVGSFNRVDRGSEPVDHHVLNLYHSPTPGLQHLSFEVQDIDDLFIGHNHLKRLGKYEHLRGVGYHVPGGQVYDYWLNPWGQMHEHWLTTRRFTAASPINLVPAPKEHDPHSRFAKTIMPQVAV